jgi:hypothetical protein
VNLQYFVGENGFARPMAKMPGDGPTWIDGLVTLGEGSAERLYAAYVKIKPPLEVYERGLCRFNDQQERFEKVAEFDMDSPLFPGGHPLKGKEDGIDYVYFGDPFPLVRVRASAECLTDLRQYEAFTCLERGSREDSLEVHRVEGNLHFSWKPNTAAYTPRLQSTLVRKKLISEQEGLFQMRDEQGKPIQIHRGSVCWNAYRKRWIMIGVQSLGSSALGEIWYAEAEQMVGPWQHACRIVTHDRYSFYNPTQHPFFDQEGGRFIFFEGTYTKTFSGNDHPTPLYDYNQIMYKLDLADPRLHGDARQDG